MDPYDVRARARLESRLRRTETGCLVWTGSTRNTDGYGSIIYRGKVVAAHRLAYALAKGPIADGVHIRHSCDNPPCCEPEHLLAGTQIDNMADRYSHGAGYARGETHPRARISERALREAADMRRAGLSWNEIVEHLNEMGLGRVHRSTIARATQHTNGLWSHIDVGRVPRHLISDEIVAEATLLRSDGVSWRDLERRFGWSRQALRYAVTTRGRNP